MDRIRMYKSPEDRAKTIADEVSEILYDNARLQRSVDSLKERLDRPTDERLADTQEKIKELEQKLAYERRNSLYTFKEEELDKSNELYLRHKASCKSRVIHYEVVGTGIGSVCYLCCKLCGFREEIGNTMG